MLMKRPWGEPFRPVVEGLKLPFPVKAMISCCRATHNTHKTIY